MVRFRRRQKDEPQDTAESAVEETEADESADTVAEESDVQDDEVSSDADEESSDADEASAARGTRVERVVSAGICTLDDDEHEVETNTWIVGDDEAVIVIDPAHDPETILDKIGEREVMAVILTHGHDDHLNASLEVAEADEDDPAPIALHPKDRTLWRDHFRRLAKEAEEDDAEVLKKLEPDIELEDGGVFEIADAQLDVIHTPGHTPGSVCLYSDKLGVLFTGDTLHKGKPGEVGGVYPERERQLNSIGALLSPLSRREIRVLPGHGDETTVDEEYLRLETWFDEARRISAEE